MDTEKTTNVIVGIIFGAIILTAFILAFAIVADVSIDTNVDNGVITTYTVTNESGGYINSTGYTLDASEATGAYSPSITVIRNASNGATITSGNYTLTGFIITNKTVTNWANVTVSYTYLVNFANTTDFNTGVESVKTGVIGLVVNFFDLAPTIGTILAVVILIGAIVMLVLYVKRMSNNNQESMGGFQG